jgi:hypothetical protein
MPSLLNTTVAANYGKMGAQDTYGTGQTYSNFGTRNLRALKITLSGGTLNNMLYQDGNASGSFANTTWVNSNSLFSGVIRVAQAFAEIYYIGQPNATDVILLVSGDTTNDAGATNNVSDGTYSQMESAIKSFIDNRTAAAQGSGAAGTATTVAVTATGTAANPAMFTGSSLGTFA